MATTAPFEPITELLGRSINIHNVYGEAVQHGDTTVIPIARVAFGFGAGGGRGPGHTHNGHNGHGEKAAEGTSDATTDAAEGDAQGAGGGGGVKMNPVGALEIGPLGTRFVQYSILPQLLGAAAAGLVLGWLVSRRRA